MIHILLGIFVISVAASDPASDQITLFKNMTSGHTSVLTTRNGAPIDVGDINALNSRLIHNEYFMGSITHFTRERIPERVVHAKGAGAIGYFEITHNVTDICKARLFSKTGKKTPVVVRFSPSTLDKGEADTQADSRGFAVKFFTEEGNWDIVGFNTPMFMIKDPNLFTSQVRASKRNPVTNLNDQKTLWDFITLRPEAAFFYMYIFGDNGIPDGFRHMPGFSIHTYQIYNERGESYFVRFHIMPDLGIKNIFTGEAVKLAGSDPDYAVKDLYNAIEMGNFPTWTISLQVLSFEDVTKADFDVFDITKTLPLSKYPLRPLGKLVLNRNPTNFFAEIEQLAMCPGNLVPGILGSPDKMFEARRLAYRDAQLYRLGANFNNIPVNCPFRNIYTYDRDGVPPVDFNGGGAPNYFPNSYNGPAPCVESNRPRLINVIHDESYNFDQARDMFNEMTREGRFRLIKNLALFLRSADKDVQAKSIKIFTKIHPQLGFKIAARLRETATNN